MQRNLMDNPGMVVPACNPSTRQVEAGESPSMRPVWEKLESISKAKIPEAEVRRIAVGCQPVQKRY
jgi:hypothetical protein